MFIMHILYFLTRHDSYFQVKIQNLRFLRVTVSLICKRMKL